MDRAKEKKDIKRKIGDNIGFFYIMPWLIGFLLFKLYPFASSFVRSFTDMHLFKGISQTGLMNYKAIFTDSAMLESIAVTFRYVLITVPLKLAAALFIAYILNFKIKGIRLFRTAYYIPSILGGSVAVAVLWKALFRNEGLVNKALALAGISGPDWLSDPQWAIYTVCLLRVWQFGSAMIIFLAALKGVPKELYEAAEIDGAGRRRKFMSITLPLITPVIFYNLVTQLCIAFQEFNGPYIITQGGPLGSTTFMSLVIYNTAFKKYQIGMGSALAWVMFAIVAVFTLIAFASQKKWVYYSDDEKK